MSVIRQKINENGNVEYVKETTIISRSLMGLQWRGNPHTTGQAVVCPNIIRRCSEIINLIYLSNIKQTETESENKTMQTDQEFLTWVRCDHNPSSFKSGYYEKNIKQFNTPKSQFKEVPC